MGVTVSCRVLCCRRLRSAVEVGLPFRTPERSRTAAAAETPTRPTAVTPLAAIAGAVGGSLKADPEESADRRLCLLDTVDRRLTRIGWRLEVEPVDAGGTQRWRLVSGSGRVRAAADVPAPTPRLVDELPDGPLYRALEPLAGIRALVPSPWIAVTEHRTALRDANGKVRCRLLAQSAAPEHPGDRCSAVRVVALKGYEADAARIAERTARRFGWSPSPPDPLATLADRLHPGAAGTAYPQVTDPAAPAGAALRPVLTALLDSVEHRAAGVIADIDCEELHELRVAVRRSRSILTLLRSERAEPELARAQAFFARLGKVTGPTRDLDVHILDWRAHRRRADARTAADLEPLGRYLKAERDRAHAALVAVLRSPRFRADAKRWRRALEAGDEAWSATERELRPVGELAGHRILKLYRRAVAEGSVITPDSPDNALHTLRKTMKKLRYVFEIVRGTYPSKPARAVLDTLKELQQELGEVQDAAVQAEALRRFGHSMGATGAAGPATLMAIGALAEDLVIRHAEARARFAAVFKPVARRRFGERLRRLTRTGNGT